MRTAFLLFSTSVARRKVTPFTAVMKNLSIEELLRVFARRSIAAIVSRLLTTGVALLQIQLILALAISILIYDTSLLVYDVDYTSADDTSFTLVRNNELVSVYNAELVSVYNAKLVSVYDIELSQSMILALSGLWYRFHLNP
ncbi:hypothetical protein HBI81_077210 [Parastagonospora nodorum]|nr:hypothetical protein HBI63_073730 [Parastagonospora nodorum]KAH6177063.1 hypothetical protein HBI61_127230 [Parastagonospora nodorum]KAH6534656.1 hypothetical protein HBI81_077210 [Parastagonospora nodorum]